MTDHDTVIDIDDRSSWPPALAALIERWDQRVATSDHTPDLRLPADADAELAAVLGASRLRARHCTRLLAHEINEVRREGLRPFTAELFDTRLARARDHDYLTQEEHQRLAAGHLGVAEPGRARYRWDRVHLTVGRVVLDDLAAVERLLGRWGGEGIYFSIAGETDKALLATLGRPTVVVCALWVDAALGLPQAFPALPNVFLGSARQLPDATANLILTRAVDSAEIELLVGPGDEPYDRHPDLPRA